MIIQPLHPEKLIKQICDGQNRQKAASAIQEYQIYFVTLQRLCAIAKYIFGLGCRCSDTFAPFLLRLKGVKKWGCCCLWLPYGYPEKEKRPIYGRFTGVIRSGRGTRTLDLRIMNPTL